MVNAITLKQKLAVEQAKLAIEIDYINKSSALQVEVIARRKDEMVAMLEATKSILDPTKDASQIKNIEERISVIGNIALR